MKKNYWFDDMVESLEEKVKRLKIMKTGTEVDEEALKRIFHEIARDIEWHRTDMIEQIIEEAKK